MFRKIQECMSLNDRPPLTQILTHKQELPATESSPSRLQFTSVPAVSVPRVLCLYAFSARLMKRVFTSVSLFHVRNYYRDLNKILGYTVGGGKLKRVGLSVGTRRFSIIHKNVTIKSYCYSKMAYRTKKKLVHDITISSLYVTLTNFRHSLYKVCNKLTVKSVRH